MPQTKTLAKSDAAARRDAIVGVFSTLVIPIAKHVASQYGIASAEDFTQDGYLGLLDAATRFESYARKRIEGSMRDSIRKRDWREAAHLRHEDIAQLPDPVGCLDNFVLLSELYTAIAAELTPREAQVVEMQLEGHTGTEIAVALEIRQQTVHVHSRRALDKLRSKLAA